MAVWFASKTIAFGLISGGRTISRLPRRCSRKIATHFWVMRSAVVTGGQGFIGRHLVKALRRRGVDVRTLGRRQSVDTAHIVLDEASWDSPALDRVFEDAAPDCIFHLAGKARGTLAELTHANLGLLQGLLRALRRTNLRPQLVVAGSAAEYGSAIGDFANQIASMPRDRGTLHVGNIDVRRDMIDVEHVATLLCQLAENPHAHGVVNVCSGQAPLLRELVEMLIQGCGRKIDIEVDWARVRGNEPRTIIGSTDLLVKLGCPPPPTDFPAVIARVCRGMEESTAGTSLSKDNPHAIDLRSLQARR